MVPLSELEGRLARFQDALRADGLDAALIVQETDLYYLTGTAQSGHLVVPADGEPTLLVRKTLARAREESPLARIEPLRSLRDLPGAIGLEGGRVGLELDVLPARSYLGYAKRLEGVELADCSSAIRRVRAVKSEYELERIRVACAQVAQLPGWMERHVREGMSELELAAEIERELRLAGHQGPIRFRSFNNELFYGSVLAGPSGAIPGASETPIVGPGPNISVSRGASARPIGRGEPILVDLAGAHDGYLSDQTRMFSLGPVETRFAETHDLAVGVLHGVAAAAKPGVTGAELYDLAQELAGGHEGFMGWGDERVTFVGHGIGLEIDELPLLARGRDETFELGMVFALEPKFVFPGEAAIGIENSYLVTENGGEALTTAPEELIEL